MDDKTKMIAVVAGIIVLVLFGVVGISLLGFFPGLAGDAKKTQSDAYWRGEAGGGSGASGLPSTPSGYYGGAVSSPVLWHYNPFDNPFNVLFFLIFVLAAPIITLMRMQKGNEWKTIGLAAIGTFFLAGAIFVLVGAFGNLFSISPNEKSGVTVGEYYGWAALSLIMLALGAGCIYMAEKWRQEGKASRSVYSVVAHTMGLFFALYSAYMLVFYSGLVVNVLVDASRGYNNYSDIIFSPMKMFGWLIYSAILAYLALKAFEYSRDAAPDEPMSNYVFNSACSLCGGILLVTSTLHGLFFLFTLIFNSPDASRYWFYNILLCFVFGGGAWYLFNFLVKHQEKCRIQRTGHWWLTGIGAILIVVGLLMGVFALYSLLGMGASEAGKSIAYAFALLLYGGAFLFVAKQMTSKPYAPSKVQEGSIWSIERKDAVAASAAAKAPGASRVSELEEKLELLEAAHDEEVALLKDRLAKLEGRKK